MKLGGKRGRYGILEVVAYSICTVAVATMFFLLFLPDPVRAGLLDGSKIASMIFEWRDWVLVAPVVVIIFFGIYGDDEL